MFERFTGEARAVVTGAVARCRGTGEPRVTDEHLLLALLDMTEGRAAFVLRALGAADRRVGGGGDPVEVQGVEAVVHQGVPGGLQDGGAD
ncbi:Clp protease N-terminal domain-containing protein, partial [Streptomyces zhihengii]